MKNILLATAICLAAGSITAQPRNGENKEARRAEIEKQKVAYITTQLEMTEKESQSFWPIYNAYQEEVSNNRAENREGRRAFRADSLALSDAEIDQKIKSRFKTERQRVDIDERYYEKFKTALPIPKVADFYRAEKDFQRELLKQMRERGPKAQGGGRQR